MTGEKLYELLGDISEPYVVQAREPRDMRKLPLFRYGIAVACCIGILAAAGVLLPMHLGGEDPIPPVSTEAIFETRYVYRIDEGMFSSYIGGKVTDAENVGEKLAEVMITAGWEDSNREWTGTESLHGEVYALIGVSPETAAVLKFLDAGEAVTTTHYYVILNPGADLHAVEQYWISPLVPGSFGGEPAGEIPE